MDTDSTGELRNPIVKIKGSHHQTIIPDICSAMFNETTNSRMYARLIEVYTDKEELK